MSDEIPLMGKTALVTGASRGLGAVIARTLQAAGAEVMASAREVSAMSGRALAADLAKPEEVERLAEWCLRHGGVDILVNNAAVQRPIGRFAAADFAAWEAVFQVNFFAPARLCQILMEPMRKMRWGKIVNLSGGGASSPRADFTAYAASKCALVRFSETLAVELAGTGVDVNCVAPGAMNTRMLDELLAAGPGGAAGEYEKALKQKQSGGASPEKAAELITLLASPACDGITGKLISAVWDDWKTLPDRKTELAGSPVYTLRRVEK